METPLDHPSSQEKNRLQLVRPIEPRLTWKDLLFEEEVAMQLQALEERWRVRREVLDGWGFGRRLKSEGVMALLSGEPGTGKTEAASVLSSALGLQWRPPRGRRKGTTWRLGWRSGSVWTWNA